ncbi:hypothetical protein SAMN04487965_1966 [Microbulbifer donghaiensis]|uniref:Alkylhydroperoxidase AhpD family core domain-containing protein n=1 Tax=Microbulbifer donghaiensis TaxID=494016 RepID=A0A1M5AU76_9GAMM|nr:hypothetical protein [Microbulbifer donghaiensis]SHF33502.1 hypothetical protein SAMN04487965_1966 [Microbulbifer donghaiensis]
MNEEQHLQALEAFSRHYRYDTGYLKEFLNGSPEGFEKFADFQPLATHREFLPLDIFWVSKLAAMQVADCGECLQLNVRMALEAGIEKSIVQACLQGGSRLPENLKDIFDFATSVASYRNIDPLLEQRIDAQLDQRQRIELGVCVATASVYPTIKRAMGYTQSCSLVEIEFAA